MQWHPVSLFALVDSRCVVGSSQLLQSALPLAGLVQLVHTGAPIARDACAPQPRQHTLCALAACGLCGLHRTD
jgi:hypothetical protein